MTWREKSVTVDQSAEELFKSVLGDIRVKENGIHREHLRGLSHWSKIRATMSRNEIFEGHLHWDDVKEVEKKSGFLTYPHIDIIIDPDEDSHWDSGKLMLFFKDDAPRGYDDLDGCLKAIKKYWNAHRQKTKQNTMRYSYDAGGQPEASGKQMDEDDAEELVQDDEPPEDEPEPEAEADEEGSSVSNLLKTAASKPKDLMDKFGS